MHIRVWGVPMCDFHVQNGYFFFSGQNPRFPAKRVAALCKRGAPHSPTERAEMKRGAPHLPTERAETKRGAPLFLTERGVAESAAPLRTDACGKMEGATPPCPRAPAETRPSQLSITSCDPKPRCRHNPPATARANARRPRFYQTQPLTPTKNLRPPDHAEVGLTSKPEARGTK